MIPENNETTASRLADTVIVAGMHRSGTSAFAGMLHLLGYRMGSTLLQPKPGENDKGFWESKEIVDLNDHLLGVFGLAWDSVRALPDGWMDHEEAIAAQKTIAGFIARDFGDKAWAVKDPRLCRFLPLWRQILANLERNPLYVIVVRHPWEVAQSLGRRNNLGSMQSSLLWMRHLLDAERDTRGCLRIFLPYDSYLVNPVGTFQRISRTCGISWPTPPEDVAGLLENFLDPKLRHHHHTATPFPSPLPSFIGDTYDLAKRAMFSNAAGLTPEFDALGRQLEPACETFVAIRTEGNPDNEKAVVCLRQENDKLTQKLDKYKRKITKLKEITRELQEETQKLKSDLAVSAKPSRSIIERVFRPRKNKE